MAVSKRLRFEIFRRDNHACRYCGRTAPEVKLTIDHVVPETLGGTDDPGNLVTACNDCNGGKSSVPPSAPMVADVAADVVRWARAMQQAADEIGAQEQSLEDVCEAVYAAWTPRWIPSDYRGSIYNFVKAGLSVSDLLDLVRTAHSARNVDDRWAYFCGCCWKRIKKRQERAAQIVTAGDEPAQGRPSCGLETVWTADDIDELLTEASAAAANWCPTIVVHYACRHRDSGHCGDPLCVVEYATGLYWAALRSQGDDFDRFERANQINDAAEALLDG